MTRLRQDSAPGTKLPGTAPTHVTINSEEPTDSHLTPKDTVHQAAIDRMWSWLFAPLPDEAQDTEVAA